MVAGCPPPLRSGEELVHLIDHFVVFGGLGIKLSRHLEWMKGIYYRLIANSLSSNVSIFHYPAISLSFPLSAQSFLPDHSGQVELDFNYGTENCTNSCFHMTWEIKIQDSVRWSVAPTHSPYVCNQWMCSSGWNKRWRFLSFKVITYEIEGCANF